MAYPVTSMRSLSHHVYGEQGENTTPYEISVRGWADAIRSHGKLAFVDLRTHNGKLQCVLRQIDLQELGAEDFVELTGKLVRRPEKMVNPKIMTGEFELVVTALTIINKSKPLPIPIDCDGREINEERRLQFRYLDLRRERMQKNMLLRSLFMRGLRAAVDGICLEIETPILTQSTKEGARDFVVPSRHSPGLFYALPQSPQQYKQLLMTAGFDGYYQIARCFRDESPRADRGFEFTQLDIELSDASETDIMALAEKAIFDGVHQCEMDDRIINTIDFGPPTRFPTMTYEEAMQKYGTDKPDVRTAKEKEEGKLAFLWITDFPMFKAVKEDDDKLDTKSEWTFMHNPFSRPINDHIAWHMTGQNIDKIKAHQYDLVCNGLEIGSGSLRAYDRPTLMATFRTMGYSAEQTEASVGHMLEAFDYGTPPHGGIALGVDRLVMLLCNETSMKEVIAFPTNGSGRSSVMNAPSEIDITLLDELKLSVDVPNKNPPPSLDMGVQEISDYGVNVRENK